MNGIDINLTVVVVAWTIASVLLAVLSLVTLRFGVVPVLGAIAVLRGSARDSREREIVRRLGEVERRLGELESGPAEKPEPAS